MNLKGLWSEFKTFAFKGNMIDLAVAVVIGAAFGGVINSLVQDIVMPAISYVTTGVTQAKDAVQTVAVETAHKVRVATKPATQETAEPATTGPTTQPTTMAAVTPAAPAPTSPPAAAPDKPVNIDITIGRFRIGSFISALLNFIIVAAAVFFIIVKLLGSMMRRVAGGTPSPSEPTTRECPECLSVIPLKAKRCAFCTAVIAANNP